MFLSLRTTSPLREQRVPRPWFSPLGILRNRSNQDRRRAGVPPFVLAGDSNFSTVCNLWFGRGEPSSLPRWFFGSTQTGRGNGPAAAALHSRLNGLCPSVRRNGNDATAVGVGAASDGGDAAVYRLGAGDGVGRGALEKYCHHRHRGVAWLVEGLGGCYLLNLVNDIHDID